MQRTAAETREHVLQVAHKLFYRDGIRATGVDKVAVEAGVGPTTLYRLFASKDDLVAAYVDRAYRHYRQWFTQATLSETEEPRERILALFEAVGQQVIRPLTRGCPFMIVLAEFPDPALPAHRNAVGMKAWVHAQIGELTKQLARTTTIADPAALADQLTLAFEGVYASAQALGTKGPARRPMAVAEVLITGSERKPLARSRGKR